MLFKKKVQIVVAFACFLLCFAITLQYKSVTKNTSITKGQLQRNEDLQTELINTNQENIELKKEILQLSSDIETYRTEMAESSDGASVLKKELDNARMLAGLTTLEGNGVVVTISDSKVFPVCLTTNSQGGIYVRYSISER